MARVPKLHSYSDESSFERLLLLVSVLANQPGIGVRRGDEGPEAEIIAAMVVLAAELEIEWVGCAIPTLRQDLALLKRYGILPNVTHRAGYRLGAEAERRTGR